MAGDVPHQRVGGSRSAAWKALVIFASCALLLLLVSSELPHRDSTSDQSAAARAPAAREDDIAAPPASQDTPATPAPPSPPPATIAPLFRRQALSANDDDVDLNVTQSILGAALADNVEALFHLPGYLTHPERERKTDVLLRIDNATVYAIKKRMFTWLYLFDERQLGASRNIAVLAVVCGGSSSSSSYSGAYNADARGSLAASDCAHVPAIFSEVKLGVGHMVVVVVGDTRGDREWLDVFVELEKAFPARFTAYHRVGSSCTSAWNLIARLAFIRMRPRSDRVMIVTPTFRPMRDVLARFAAYGRWKNAHLARLMEPPAPPETPETQGGKSRPSSCFCNALLLTREGYARNGGFAEDVHADCAAAEADFFHVAASSGAAGAAVEFIRVASSAAVPANAIRPVFGRSGANPRNMARSESIGEAPMTAEQLEQFCACSK